MSKFIEAAIFVLASLGCFYLGTLAAAALKYFYK